MPYLLQERADGRVLHVETPELLERKDCRQISDAEAMLIASGKVPAPIVHTPPPASQSGPVASDAPTGAEAELKGINDACDLVAETEDMAKLKEIATSVGVDIGPKWSVDKAQDAIIKAIRAQAAKA